jgi:hypothetical protein
MQKSPTQALIPAANGHLGSCVAAEIQKPFTALPGGHFFPAQGASCACKGWGWPWGGGGGERTGKRPRANVCPVCSGVSLLHT